MSKTNKPRVRDSFSGNTNRVYISHTGDLCECSMTNDGATDLVFTINGKSITLKPGESIDEAFDCFTTVTIVTTSSYRCVVRGF